MAWANYELGRIALDDQDAERRDDVKRLDKLLNLSDEDGLKAWVHYSLALRERSEGREEGLKHAKEALKGFQRHNDVWGIAQCYNVLGQFSAFERREEEAEQYFTKAAEIGEREDFPGVRAAAALNISTLAPRRRSIEETRTELEEALDLYVGIEDMRGVRRAREGLRKLASTQDH